MSGYKKIVLYFFLVAVGVETLSFFAHQFPVFHILSIILVVGLFTLVCVKYLHLGFSLLMLELLIGSKGHLLSFTLWKFNIGLRLVLFVIFFVIGTIKTYKNWLNIDKKLLYPTVGLFTIIIFGFLLGLTNNQFRDVFFDANGYFYFSIIFIASSILQKKENITILYQAFIAGIMWLFLKTYILLFIFSHLIEPSATIMYRWVRDTGAAEPTRLADGMYRIFFQSHIYALIGFFVFLVILILQKTKKDFWTYIFLITSTFLMIIVSFSRSFWISVVFLVFILSLVWLIYLRNYLLLRAIKILLLVGIFTIGLIYINISFPLERFVGIDSIVKGEFVKERLGDLDTEAAASSRWAQLAPLLNAIKRRPLFGYGFGKTIIYKSSDPRNLAKNPQGWYRTYAFEWGYLDMLLKIGLLGILIFGWLILQILMLLFQEKDRNSLLVILALLVVLLTHIFTPYLNHPLGIGVVVFAFAFINSKYYNRIEDGGNHE